MKSYNAPRQPPDRRQLTYYSTIGTLPPVHEVPNLHACAHLYASDRNSLFIIPRFWEIEDNFLLASLNHTVVFHGGAETLDMASAREEERWFVQESWTDRLGDGRGIHHSRLLDANGRHVASTMQDGMVTIGIEREGALQSLTEKYGYSKSKL